MIIKLTTFSMMVAGGCSLGAALPASSESYLSPAITMVVPSPPGGSTDVIGHIVAERMRTLLGQPVIIENVGGAGGGIGVGRVARAAADGYTIDIGQ